jgi:hypothetical protein
MSSVNSGYYRKRLQSVEKWFDKLFNVKYLHLFHHFKAIYQFPKQIIVLVKIVANAPLKK